MKWIFALISVGCLVVAGALYNSVRSGYEPGPVKEIKPTEFQVTEQAGALVYRRSFIELRNQPLVILASFGDPEKSEKLWRGFVRTALKNEKFDHLILTSGSSDLLNEGPGQNFSQLSDEQKVNGIADLIEKGQRILLVGQSENWSSQLKGPLALELEKKMGRAFLTYTQRPFSELVIAKRAFGRETPLHKKLVGMDKPSVSEHFVYLNYPEQQPVD